MSKTFRSVNADAKKDLLVVLEVEEGVNIHTESPVDRRGVSIAPSDAPAVMLAIGEVTGVEPALEMYSKYGTPEHLAHIQWHLHEYVKAQKANAAAEADRVKLEQEALALCNAYRKSYGASHITSFGEYSINEDDWLAVARAARELNKEDGQ